MSPETPKRRCFAVSILSHLAWFMAGRWPRACLQLHREPAIAAEMPGCTETAAQGLKARPRVEVACGLHASHGFQIAGLVSETARHAQAVPQQQRPHAVTARSGQEVHLAQFADLEVCACKRCYAGAA